MQFNFNTIFYVQYRSEEISPPNGQKVERKVARTNPWGENLFGENIRRRQTDIYIGHTPAPYLAWKSNQYSPLIDLKANGTLNSFWKI